MSAIRVNLLQLLVICVCIVDLILSNKGLYSLLNWMGFETVDGILYRFTVHATIAFVLGLTLLCGILINGYDSIRPTKLFGVGLVIVIILSRAIVLLMILRSINLFKIDLAASLKFVDLALVLVLSIYLIQQIFKVARSKAPYRTD